MFKLYLINRYKLINTTLPNNKACITARVVTRILTNSTILRATHLSHTAMARPLARRAHNTVQHYIIWEGRDDITHSLQAETSARRGRCVLFEAIDHFHSAIEWHWRKNFRLFCVGESQAAHSRLDCADCNLIRSLSIAKPSTISDCRRTGFLIFIYNNILIVRKVCAYMLREHEVNLSKSVQATKYQVLCNKTVRTLNHYT